VVDGAFLDGLMADAWPAVTTELCDGWVFRFADGVTRRANSALVVGQPSDLAEAISAAERFYAARGADPTFLLTDASSPPAAVDALRSRGYRPTATTSILGADASTVADDDGSDGAWHVEVDDQPTDEWFDVYRSVAAHGRSPSELAVLRHVLLDPVASSAFVTLTDQHGATMAVGQVVVDRGWGCIQCLATLAPARRLGAGRLVTQTLARQAASNGAVRVFAAVMADNDASLGLMASLGFGRNHQYSYYVR